MIESADIESITSESLVPVKETLEECFFERKLLLKEIRNAKFAASLASAILFASKLLLIGFFVPWFKKNLNLRSAFVVDLLDDLSKCYIDVDINLGPEYEGPYFDAVAAYADLCTSSKIWDLISERAINSVAERTIAGATVNRKEVVFGRKELEFIRSKHHAMHLQNANGADLYIYPAFIVVLDSLQRLGVIDPRDLKFNYSNQKFIEPDKVPSDALVVGNTWFKANKDGSRDKRFKGNYEIPICRYGYLEFTTASGIHEAYLVSSSEKTLAFGQKMSEFIKTIGNLAK